jgi:hypothetical protein
MRIESVHGEQADTPERCADDADREQRECDEQEDRERDHERDDSGTGTERLADDRRERLGEDGDRAERGRAERDERHEVRDPERELDEQVQQVAIRLHSKRSGEEVEHRASGPSAVGAVVLEVVHTCRISTKGLNAAANFPSQKLRWAF